MSGGNRPDSLPRNYLQPCLLLLLSEKPSHGYELIEGIGRLGIVDADPGGVYRALRGMESEGLVTSFWEQSTAGPARRSYELTDTGRTPRPLGELPAGRVTLRGRVPRARGAAW